MGARRTVLYYGEKTSPGTPGDQNSRYYVASATTVLQVVDGAQEACDFLLAQHDGKLLCLTAGGDVVLDNPRPFEGGVVEKSEPAETVTMTELAARCLSWVSGTQASAVGRPFQSGPRRRRASV